MASMRAVLCISSMMLFVLLVCPVVQAQCPPGKVLFFEDDDYWYCKSPATSASVEEAIESFPKERSETLGDEWRFRKAMIEAVAHLHRTAALYQMGGKVRVTWEGKETYICLPESSQQCRNDPRGVDCSGAVEYGELSACFVSGFYSSSSHSLAGLWGLKSAAEQAEYFKRKKVFMGKSALPTAGDLMFFEKTVGHKKGITHVAIFIGTTKDGRTVILHASSRAGKVVFDHMDSFLSKRLAGYGNISKLYIKSR